LEGLIKRFQEKRAEKKTFKEFGDKLSEFIKNNDQSLDERLLELTGKKKSEKIKRYILAGAAGTVVASGLLGRVIRWGVEETGLGKSIKGAVTGGFEHKPPSPELAVSHEPGYVPHEALEYPAYGPPPGPEYPAYELPRGGPEIAGKGDSVWKIIGRQLSDRYGEKFNNLDEARKTYVIDALKDKVAANPEKYGLTDVDQIQAGKTYDFLPGSKMEIDKVFENADALKQAQLESILEHNKAIKDWVTVHPGERLTTEKIDEILYGRKISPVKYSPYEIRPAEETSGEYVPKKEELPGEEIIKAKPEIKPEEMRWSSETESQMQEIMANNEMACIKAIGFTEGEYKAIANLKIGKLIEQIPSRDQAWEIWRSDKAMDIDLPHDGIYGAIEFGRHIKLAEFIRSYQPGDWVKEMTVKEFLQRFGPKFLQRFGPK